MTLKKRLPETASPRQASPGFAKAAVHAQSVDGCCFLPAMNHFLPR